MEEGLIVDGDNVRQPENQVANEEQRHNEGWQGALKSSRESLLMSSEGKQNGMA